MLIYAKATKVNNWLALSASGSISFPKFETKLNFLAIIPSKTSVNPEIVSKIAAVKNC